VTQVLDKHAFRFHLGRQKWNGIHLTVGAVGLVLALIAVPLQSHAAIAVSFAALVVILAIDIAAYAKVANADERVPEEYRITFNMSSWKEAREAKAAAKKQAKVELSIKKPDKQLLTAPEAETEAYAVRSAAEGVYMKAIERRAQQVDLAPAANNVYAVSYLIDGVRQPGEPLPAPEAIKIIDFWKTATNLDVNDRRRQLAGDCIVEHSGVTHNVRIMTSGGQAGMRLTMVFDLAKAVHKGVDDLGLLDAQKTALEELAAECQGVVLLAAPPDMGRTTTLYSVLRLHDAYTSNVQTVETDIQDAIEGVRQNRWDPTAEGGPEYSTLVRSILRRDPDVVAVADVVDPNTAKEIAKADHERTRVYASLRVDGALNAIQGFVNAVGEREAAAKALHGAMAQRLMRRLCPNCKVPYQPSPEMLKKLGLPADKVKQLHKKGGQVLIKNKPEVCPMCQGVGYYGQIGVFEVFRLGPEERTYIRDGNFPALAAALRKKGLPTMQQAALMRAVDGTTSVEEVTRVMAAEAGGGGGGAGSGPGQPPAKPKPSPAASPA
jgi:type II secretory ATPase GspE/PulE/Tfp pilus assembly ATPase PilB-like protein